MEGRTPTLTPGPVGGREFTPDRAKTDGSGVGLSVRTAVRPSPGVVVTRSVSPDISSKFNYSETGTWLGALPDGLVTSVGQRSGRRVRPRSPGEDGRGGSPRPGRRRSARGRVDGCRSSDASPDSASKHAISTGVVDVLTATGHPHNAGTRLTNRWSVTGSPTPAGRRHPDRPPHAGRGPPR